MDMTIGGMMNGVMVRAELQGADDAIRGVFNPPSVHSPLSGDCQHAYIMAYLSAGGECHAVLKSTRVTIANRKATVGA